MNPDLPFKRLAVFWSNGTSLRQTVTARLGPQRALHHTFSADPYTSRFLDCKILVR